MRGCAPHLAYVGLCPTPRLVASRGPMPCAASSRARMRAPLNANATRGPRSPTPRPRGAHVRALAVTEDANAVQAGCPARKRFSWRGVRLARRGFVHAGLCPAPHANATRGPPKPHSASAGRARARPGCDRGRNAVQPGCHRFSWRGVRLARRDEGAARRAVTKEATPSRRTPRQENPRVGQAGAWPRQSSCPCPRSVPTRHRPRRR